MRFITAGTEVLKDRIAHDLILIREAVLRHVHAGEISGLVLGGGYGRGEGGVYVTNGEERVYNDYDFFVIVPFRSRRRRTELMAKLAEVKATVEPLCGIHVDFSPPMPASSLPALPYEVMFMELKEGHHVVLGPRDILSTMPDYDVAHPPMEECARLFMNRGVGLLLARQKLKSGSHLSMSDHEFVVRNIRKAQLAMGDSLLFLYGCYSASYIERRKRFFTINRSNVPDAETLGRYYSEAIDFKLKPQHVVPENHSLDSWHDEVTQFYERMFLWFESQRLNDSQLTWERYMKRFRRLPYRGLAETAINVVRNLRIKTSRLPSVREMPLHPRDRVLARLPALLFAKDTNDQATTDVLILWKLHG